MLNSPCSEIKIQKILPVLQPVSSIDQIQVSTLGSFSSKKAFASGKIPLAVKIKKTNTMQVSRIENNLCQQSPFQISNMDSTDPSLSFHLQRGFSCPKLQYNRKRDVNWSNNLDLLMKKHRKTKKKIERTFNSLSSSKKRLSPIKSPNSDHQFRAFYYQS